MRQLRWAKMQKSQEMVITARRAIWELAEWIDVACAGDQRKINYICDLLDRALGLHSHGFDYWMSELLNTVTNRVEVESRKEQKRMTIVSKKPSKMLAEWEVERGMH